MAKLSLKTILKKNPEVTALINSLTVNSATGVYIEDKEGNSFSANQFPIHLTI